MKPIAFPRMTLTLAKDQPEYQPLPVHVSDDGIVTSCWQLEPIEVEYLIANGGKLWLQQLTFHAPLQPQLPSVIEPKLE
jgi:hypothetical protein